jgi:hypothetical protein
VCYDVVSIVNALPSFRNRQHSILRATVVEW